MYKNNNVLQTKDLKPPCVMNNPPPDYPRWTHIFLKTPESRQLRPHLALQLLPLEIPNSFGNQKVFLKLQLNILCDTNLNFTLLKSVGKTFTCIKSFVDSFILKSSYQNLPNPITFSFCNVLERAMYIFHVNFLFATQFCCVLKLTVKTFNASYLR